MIRETMKDIIEFFSSEYKEMKSNIISIQEEEDNSDYKLYFWSNVFMIIFFTLMTTLAAFLAIMTIWLIAESIGLKALLPIIIVAVVIYVMFKTEVLYKLLYKLFKKDNKENDK